MDKIRVLVVDDSPFSQKMLANALANSEYEVCGFAGTGGEGIAKYGACRPDVVTMDITLPDIDGLACCREILNFDPKAKIVVVSSMNDAAIIHNGTAIGVKGFVQKPVKSDKLKTALHTALNEDKQAEDYHQQLLQYFIKAFEGNLAEMVGIKSTITVTRTTGDKLMCHGLGIIIGISGTRHGRVILDLSLDTAKQFAVKVLDTDTVSEDDILNSITEFANIVTGHSVSQINNIFKGNKFEIRTTPPSVFVGQSIIVNPKLASSTVKAETEIGELYMNVGFVGRE